MWYSTSILVSWNFHSLIVYDHCSPIGYISPFYPPETLGLLPCLLAKARIVHMSESVRIKMLVKPPMFVGIVFFSQQAFLHHFLSTNPYDWFNPNLPRRLWWWEAGFRHFGIWWETGSTVVKKKRKTAVLGGLGPKNVMSIAVNQWYNVAPQRWIFVGSLPLG